MNDVSRDASLRDTGDVAGPAHDRIFLHDYVAAIEVGAYADEYGVTQTLRFNVDLDVRRFRADYADEVESVVSYDLIIETISDLASGPRMKLLETFAERMADRLLAERRVARALIRIEKLDRVAGALGIEIERRSLASG
ncbi:MAG: dihydroneopterin aldolase [Pseudomonadota bacterium]